MGPLDPVARAELERRLREEGEKQAVRLLEALDSDELSEVDREQILDLLIDHHQLVAPLLIRRLESPDESKSMSSFELIRYLADHAALLDVDAQLCAAIERMCDSPVYSRRRRALELSSIIGPGASGASSGIAHVLTRSTDPEERKTAATALRLVANGSSTARLVLARAVRDDDPDVQALALDALSASRVDPSYWLQGALDALTSDESTTHRAAAVALSTLPKTPSHAVPALVTLARQSEDPTVLEAISVALGRSDAPESSAIVALVELAGNANDGVRLTSASAVTALSGAHPVANQSVITSLASPDPVLRNAFASAICALAPERCQALAGGLGDLLAAPNPNVRMVALRALAHVQQWRERDAGDDLLTALVDPDPDVRLNALVVCAEGRNRVPDAILCDLICDSHAAVRQEAAILLVGVDDRQAGVQREILDAMQSSDELRVRRAVLASRGHVPVNALIPALVHVASHHTRATRELALRELVPLGAAGANAVLDLARQGSWVVDALADATVSEDAAPLLLAAMSSDNDVVRALSVHLLSSTNTHATTYLLPALRDPSALVRGAALDAVMESANEPAIHAEVRSCLNDPILRVRIRAAERLWALTGDIDSPIAALLQVIDDDSRRPNSEAEDLIREAATSLGRFGPDAGSAVPAIVRRLREEHPSPTLLACVSALGAIGAGDPETVAILGLAVDDRLPRSLAWNEDARVALRTAAAEALGRIGQCAQSALPALGRAEVDADPTLREAARRAIASIR